MHGDAEALDYSGGDGFVLEEVLAAARKNDSDPLLDKLAESLPPKTVEQARRIAAAALPGGTAKARYSKVTTDRSLDDSTTLFDEVLSVLNWQVEYTSLS